MTGDTELKQRSASLLNTLNTLAIPYSWLKPLGSHTAALVLAEILTAHTSRANEYPTHGRELLLGCKELAAKLAISDRTLTRALQNLANRKAIIYQRKDRIVGGRKRRNVVSVTPNLHAIATLSGIRDGDSVSARSSPSPAQSCPGHQTHSATNQCGDSDHPPLSASQESLHRAYRDCFQEIIGSPYKARPDQQLADRQAAGTIEIPKGPRADCRYLSWARQYLQAMRDKAEEQYGAAIDGAFARDGHVRDPYTFQVFVAWAGTNDLLPSGRPRRTFK